MKKLMQLENKCNKENYTPKVISDLHFEKLESDLEKALNLRETLKQPFLRKEEIALVKLSMESYLGDTLTFRSESYSDELSQLKLRNENFITEAIGKLFDWLLSFFGGGSSGGGGGSSKQAVETGEKKGKAKAEAEIKKEGDKESKVMVKLNSLSHLFNFQNPDEAITQLTDGLKRIGKLNEFFNNMQAQISNALMVIEGKGDKATTKDVYNSFYENVFNHLDKQAKNSPSLHDLDTQQYEKYIPLGYPYEETECAKLPCFTLHTSLNHENVKKGNIGFKILESKHPNRLPPMKQLNFENIKDIKLKRILELLQKTSEHLVLFVDEKNKIKGTVSNYKKGVEDVAKSNLNEKDKESSKEELLYIGGYFKTIGLWFVQMIKTLECIKEEETFIKTLIDHGNKTD